MFESRDNGVEDSGEERERSGGSWESWTERFAPRSGARRRCHTGARGASPAASPSERQAHWQHHFPFSSHASVSMLLRALCTPETKPGCKHWVFPFPPVSE